MLTYKEVELLLTPLPVPTRTNFMRLLRILHVRYDIPYDGTEDLEVIEEQLIRMVMLREHSYWAELPARNHDPADRFGTDARRRKVNDLAWRALWMYSLAFHVREQYSFMTPNTMHCALVNLEKHFSNVPTLAKTPR